METRKKKKLLNILMVFLILVIAFCGVMTVGSFRGWFSSEDDSLASVQKVTGVVNIERKGVGYTLKSGQTLTGGDVIETKQGSQAELSLDDQGILALNEGTEASVSQGEDGSLELEIENGELFADTAAEGKKLRVSFRGNFLYAEGAVLSSSIQAGSVSIHVFAGEAEVEAEDGSRENAVAGETLSVLTDAYDQITMERSALDAKSLNEFLILQAMGCTSKNELCFSAAELQQVLDDREAEKQRALEESLNSGSVIAVDKGDSETEAQSDPDGKGDSGEDANNSGDGAEVSGGVDSVGSGGENGNLGSGAPADSSGGEEAQQEVNTCTIEIRCDTILDNMDDLSDGKEAYVPANGCILSTSVVEFEDGETVFDVLTRVCDYAGIQIEYSWTPMYNSYYIEGINQLYEFDCGNESGWMYKVNGWFPNYGCSSYTLEDGDAIVWCYTCALGDDVGGGM